MKAERQTIGGSAWYSLEHVSVARGVENFRVVRCFGVASYRKLKLMKGDLPRKDVCGIYGEQLYRGRYHGNVKEFWLRWMLRVSVEVMVSLLMLRMGW